MSVTFTGVALVRAKRDVEEIVADKDSKAKVHYPGGLSELLIESFGV